MALLDKLRNELSRRIKQDRPAQWHEDTWLKTTLGDFYGKGAGQLPVIHRVVGECVDNLLRPNWQMSVPAWQGLQRAIDGTDTPESALPDMVRAALNVDPRQFRYFRADEDSPKPLRKGKKERIDISTTAVRKRKGTSKKKGE